MGMMSTLSRIFAARRSRDGRQPEVRPIPYTPRTVARVHVTPDTAMQNPAVFACVRYLSQSVAQLPWRVMRELPRGGGEVVNRHPTDNVLARRPNPELSPFQFKETMIAWSLMWGNGYAEIVRDGAGRVVELWPIHPRRVEVRRDAATDVLFYRVNDTVGRGSVDLPLMDMFHVRGFGNGPVGLSVIEHAAQSIGWSRAAELFGAAFFGNGMNFGGFIEVQGTLSTEGWQRLRESLRQSFGGPTKANQWVPLDANMKANKLTQTADEAQFVETMQFQVETICRWFGVPPHKIMHMLRSTFSNIEHQAIEVVVDSITPWVLRLEEEADWKLFGQNLGGFYTNLDIRGLMRGDNVARGTYYKTMREIGAYSVNEIRLLEGDNPIGPEGDKRLVNNQLTTLEQAGAQPAASPPTPDNPSDDETMAANALYWRAFNRAVHHAT